MLPFFSLEDSVRRAAGHLLEKAGYGPHETAWHRIDRSRFRLRRYLQSSENEPPTLIVPAPIKRAYIFDLLPSVSVVRRLADAGFAVYLYEWPEEGEGNWDLAATVSSLRLAAEMIAAEHRCAPILVGHSLGGTLAAITAAVDTPLVSKLVLIEAPLKFGEQTGALEPIVLSSPAVPLGSVPGSLLDLAGVAAAPDEFVFGRYADAYACLQDQEASAIHLAVIRWSLDEFSPSGRLIQDVLQLLYREDRFARNQLHLLGRFAGCDLLAKIPVAAIVDHASRVVPTSSALGGLRNPSIFPYERELGVALQHVGPLVGRQAHKTLWPLLVDWMRRTER
jgi:polyhydroxyalkanoate synthase